MGRESIVSVLAVSSGGRVVRPGVRWVGGRHGCTAVV